MRVMAHCTLGAGVMVIGVDPPDVGPPARRVGEGVMAPQALRPAPVYRQLRRVRGMIQDRTMAVFAGNDSMGSPHDAFIFIAVTVLAVFAVEGVFYFEVLPVFFIALSVQTIHVSSFADAEVFGNENVPDNEYESHETDYNVEGPPNMTFHSVTFSSQDKELA